MTSQPTTGNGSSEPRRAAARHWMAACGPAALATATVLVLSAAPARVLAFPVVAGIAVALVILVGVALPFRRRRVAEDDEPESVFGYLGAVRCVLAVAVGAVLLTAQEATGQRVGAVLAVCVLVGAVVLEPILLRLSQAKIPFVAHLPGTAPVRPLPELDLVIVGANLLAVTAGLGCGALDLPGWLWTVVALLSLIPAGLLAWAGRDRLLRGRRLEAEIGPALAAFDPEFVVYTSRPDDASYQVAMWLPYLQRAGRRFVIVTRDRVPAEALAKLTDVPVVVRRRLGDLDDVVTPSLRAAFYVNASSGNGAFIRYTQLTHVYLGHGDSDKPPSYNPTHAMYDKIFAAGPAATRRYAAHGVNIPADKFEIVGRPQVEDVQPAVGPIAEVERPTVLYAPTWRGHVEETLLYSLPVGERIVSELLAREATVIFRPHPFSYSFPDDAAVITRIQQMLAIDAERTGRRHLWGAAAETERGILDCFNASDAMVSDVSSVVSDYLFSGKPFAMVAVPTDPAVFVEEYPIARAAYVVDSRLGNLARVLDDLLGPDPAASRRRAIRVDYLGDFPAEGYAEAFVQAVRRVSELPPHPAEQTEQTEEAVGTAAAADRSGLRRDVAFVARALVVTGTALLSLAVAMLQGPAVLAGLLGWLSIALMAVAHRRDLSRSDRRIGLVGSFDIARSVLVLSIGTELFTRHGPSGWTISAVCLLLFATTAEQVVADGWGRKGLEASGLPGLNVSVSTPRSLPLLPLVHWAVLALGWVLALVDAPVVWFALALVPFALFVEPQVRSTVRVYRVVDAEARLRPALIDYAPQFAVYFSSTVGAAYQIGMWLPYLRRIGRPFIIVVRSVPMLREVASLTDVPVIQRPTLRSLEDVVVPSLRVAFYVNNAVRNTHFVERRELTHIWLNHGDSEKPACYNPVHAIYDLIFAAGQAGIDRYARHGVEIPREKFRIVGRPQVEVITPARAAIREISAPTVLYAPTWQGPYADAAVYSLPQGRRIVQALLDRRVRVVFRAHPFNYRFPQSRALVEEIGRLLAEDRAQTGREHVFGDAAERELTVEECFNLSDAMVSDVSAVVSDYLKSGKPFAMVSVGRSPEQLLQEAPAARAAYVIREDLANLADALDLLLGTDPLAGVRDETRVYYLGDFPADGYAQGFVDAALTVIDQPVDQHA